jgi:predicted TIM-barrel enzyme
VSLGETGETVEFMGADCVIVTGTVTGKAPTVEDVLESKAHCTLPVILGSGINEKNIEKFYPHADGFIVGTSFKEDEDWAKPVDATRVNRFMQIIGRLKRSEPV